MEAKINREKNKSGNITSVIRLFSNSTYAFRVLPEKYNYYEKPTNIIICVKQFLMER